MPGGLVSIPGELMSMPGGLISMPGRSASERLNGRAVNEWKRVAQILVLATKSGDVDRRV